MSVDENKALVRRYIDVVWNKGDSSMVAEFVEKAVINHVAETKGLRGADVIAKGFDTFHTVFPDFRTTVDQVIGEGDRVVVRWTSKGTYKPVKEKGEGGAARGSQQATWTGINIYRIADGKIAEIWANADALGQAYQLGWISARGKQSAAKSA